MNTWTHSKREKLGILTVAGYSGNDCTENYIILLKFDRKTNVVDPDLVKHRKKKNLRRKTSHRTNFTKERNFWKQFVILSVLIKAATYSYRIRYTSLLYKSGNKSLRNLMNTALCLK